jgi:rhodanese-related sulfurtransferase
VARSVDDLLAAARARLPHRPRPDELEAALAQGALIVDIRPVEQRRRDGELPGALVIDRNVLEWRLDPACPHRIPEAAYDRPVVIVCNEGYASSLAAASLQDLGVHGATDLDGGVQAWLRSARALQAAPSSLPDPAPPQAPDPVPRAVPDPAPRPAPHPAPRAGVLSPTESGAPDIAARRPR